MEVSRFGFQQQATIVLDDIGIGTGGAGGAIAPPIFLEGGLSPPNILGRETEPPSSPA